MYFLVVYVTRFRGKVRQYNSPFLHSSREAAKVEASAKKFYGGLPVVDYFIDSLLLND